MDYKSIEDRFKDETSIETLLIDYEDKFQKVEEDAEKLINGSVSLEEVEEILKTQTGIYMLLNIVTEIAETVKKKEEGRINYEKIQECEASGKKVVQTSIDKIVSTEVQYLRRVRNLFKAYRDSCDKCILSCQSILKKPQRNINVEE